MKDCTSSLSELPSRGTPRYAEDLAASATLTALAASAQKHYQLYGFIISTDTAGTYALSMGAEVIGKYFLGATNGLAITFTPFYCSTGNINEAVTLSKPAGANTSITTFAGLV